MIEIQGELWDFYKKNGATICLTVNGTIKANGSAVMGRGCALEALKKFPEIAGVWGKRLKNYGLKLMYLHEFDLFMFPVKYNWWEPADLKLIEESAIALARAAEYEDTIILPRPGCGNGRLTWEQVKPVISSILPNNVKVISR